MSMGSEGGGALVPGGARGIGEATADRLAEDGALIAIGDLDGEGAAAAASRIAARHGVKAIGIKANIAIATEVEATVGEIVERLRRPALPVHQARVTPH